MHLEGCGEGYFILKNSHPNFDATYSLILLAASNRYILWLRTKVDRDNVTDKHVEIEYAVVDF